MQKQQKIWSNEPVSQILTEIANYLEKEKENPHKVRTYRQAAFIVKTLPFDVTLMEQLTSIKGIGDTLAGEISEILNTGTCSKVNKLREKFKGSKNE